VGQVRRLILEDEGGMVLIYQRSGKNAGVLPVHGMRGMRRGCDLVLSPDQTGLPIPFVVLPEKLRWVATEVLAEGDLLLQLDAQLQQKVAESRNEAVQALLALGRQQEAAGSGKEPELTDEMIQLWPVLPENAEEMVALHGQILGWMDRLDERSEQATASVKCMWDWTDDNIEPLADMFATSLGGQVEQLVAVRGTSRPRRVRLKPLVVGWAELHLELRKGPGTGLLLALVARDSAGAPVEGAGLKVVDADSGESISEGVTDSQYGSVECPLVKSMTAEAVRIILSVDEKQHEGMIISIVSTPEEPASE